MISFAPWRPRRPAADGDTADLLARLARGDRAALEALYRREAGAVYRYALAFSGNPAWAADATQEAFLALAARPQTYDAARATLGAYLAGAARHQLLAQWRSRRDHEPLDDDGPPEPGQAVSPESLMVREQATQALWAALRELPAAFREALVLVDLQERSYAEAAQIAGIELNTLRTRVHRARLRLKAVLDARPGDLA